MMKLDNFRFVGDKYTVILKIREFFLKTIPENYRRDLFDNVGDFVYGGKERMFYEYYETLEETCEGYMEDYFNGDTLWLSKSDRVIYM